MARIQMARCQVVDLSDKQEDAERDGGESRALTMDVNKSMMSGWNGDLSRNAGVRNLQIQGLVPPTREMILTMQGTTSTAATIAVKMTRRSMVI